MQGYYMEEYNFSVRYHNGQWCCFCRMPDDVIAERPEHVAAVLMWAAANIEKYRSASNAELSRAGHVQNREAAPSGHGVGLSDVLYRFAISTLPITIRRSRINPAPIK